MTIPRATARLQLHKDFTFDDAAAVVAYYAKLGISHLYLSPILTARAGSTHGYDVVDPTRINPELGGEEGFRLLAAAARESGMGIIVDIVPNHMGVGHENPWWQHVLEWGRESPYAGWFDIDWESQDPALRGKMLAPFLGQQYGDALSAGELQLRYDADNGKINVAYYDNRFPLAVETYTHVLRVAGSPRLEPVITAFELIRHGDTDAVRHASSQAAFLLLREIGNTTEGAADIDAALACFSKDTEDGMEALHQLLEKQHYRLTWWRNAAEEINWRRFFEVSDLAGLRVEQEEVFEASHALIFGLYAEGLIDGVRVDHVDGMADPGGYCRKLRQRLMRLQAHRPEHLRNAGPYLIVEKILGPDEPLRIDWDIDGTTGYEFMDQVGALLHDPAGAEPLARLWRELTGDDTGFGAEVRAARRQLLAQHFVGEFDAVARALHAIARSDLRTRDISLPAIRRVLTELLVHFPVYRTYAGKDGRNALDQQVFDRASDLARLALNSADRPLLEAIDCWLGGEAPSGCADNHTQDLRLRAITRFQQLTPPLAAKSVEDTAFYRYGRLLSRNEVGADPARFSITVDEFHRANIERVQRFPNSLLATATHDHKRGEDLRVRIAVLSEIPQQWEQTVQHWMSLNAPLRSESEEGPVPSPADELMLYQMLVGAWPLDLVETDVAGVHAFAERIGEWQTKALREAKRASSWMQPNEAYEGGCRDFLHKILGPAPGNFFPKELAAWTRRLAPAAAVNGFAQTVLRLSSPGIPDLYQGTEFWDFSLVDPDNRRPVDFAKRELALDRAKPVIERVDGPDWTSGALKQEVIHRALTLRARQPDLFARGEYVALAVEGERAANVIAFLRHHAEQAAITIATRLSAKIVGQAGPVIPQSAWQDTVVVLPDGLDAVWTDVFTGRRMQAASGRLRLADVLGVLPVALLAKT
jgi:(1->4)-alpha-D-glucan 1-alpha-D-glucosylmutase